MTRWTEDDLARVRQRLSSPTPLSAIRTDTAKYRNKPVEIDGKRFASKLEGRCYEWLKLREKAGDVRWFIRQVRFELEGGVVYVADFLAETYKGPEVIDAKGVITPSCRDKLKQLRARFGIEVTLWNDRRKEALTA